MSRVKEIPNPLRELRKTCGLTQVFVARELDLSAQYVMRCEQGLYADMDSRLFWYYVNFLMLRGKTSPYMTYASGYLAYERFKKLMRVRTYEQLVGWIELTMRPMPSIHPLVVLRNESNLSRIGFAKGFCVSQSLVERWECRSHMVKEVPPVIVEALRDGGVEELKINILSEAYRCHLEWLKSAVSYTGKIDSRKPELEVVT